MSPGVSLDAQAPGFSLPGYQHTSPLALLTVWKVLSRNSTLQEAEAAAG